jgi:hypothetical protein
MKARFGGLFCLVRRLLVCLTRRRQAQKNPLMRVLPFSFALLHHSLPGLILAWLKLPSSAASSVFT